MQYILTEEEYKMGHRLIESWREHDLSLEDVYERSDSLNKQGWFTVISNEEANVDLFEIIIYGKA